MRDSNFSLVPQFQTRREVYTLRPLPVTTLGHFNCNHKANLSWSIFFAIDSHLLCSRIAHLHIIIPRSLRHTHQGEKSALIDRGCPSSMLWPVSQSQKKMNGAGGIGGRREQPRREIVAAAMAAQVLVAAAE